MLQTWFRLSFAVLWLVTGTTLLIRHYLFRPGFLAQFDQTYMTVGGLLALLLAGYNLLRLRMIRRPRRPGPLNPLARKRGESSADNNPELDFGPRDRD